MTPELQNALAELATKLGTTADRVLPMLAEKVKFEAFVYMATFGTGAALALAATAVCVYGIRNWDWEEYDFTFPSLMGSIGLFLLLTIAAISNISNYRYPEAKALQTLVSQR